jgi:TrmH family RNA methyltransferase
MKLKPYHKESLQSYTLGIFPTLELILQKPEIVVRVIFTEHARTRQEFEKLEGLCTKHEIPFSYDPLNVEKLSHKDNTDVIGVFHKYPMTLTKDADHILLYQPADIGNVGMIIRSAAGFDRPNIGIISPGVDAFNPRVIRASMGAFFTSNIEYFADLDSYMASYTNKIYAFDIKATQGLRDLKPTTPNTYLFGTESDGLPDELLSLAELVKIEYNSQALESLNLANAVSIALYASYVA